MPCLDRPILIGSWNAIPMPAVKDCLRVPFMLLTWIITTHAIHCHVFIVLLAFLPSLAQEVPTSLLPCGHMIPSEAKGLFELFVCVGYWPRGRGLGGHDLSDGKVDVHSPWSVVANNVKIHFKVTLHIILMF